MRWYSFPILMLLFVLAACEGPQGPSGRDAEVGDTQAPSINWLSPSGGDTLRGTTELRVVANDNGVIDSIRFYVNGTDSITGLRRIADSANIRRATWDLTQVRQGLYSLAARAFDRAGNVGITPSIFVWVNFYASGIGQLANFVLPLSTVGNLLPDTDGTSEYATRLRPVQACSLLTVHFAARPSRNGQTRFPALKVYLYSDVSNFPGSRLDSAIIDSGSYAFTGALDTIQVNHRLISSGTTVYLSIALADTNVQDTIIILRDQATAHRSDVYRVSTGWTAFSASVANNLAIGATVLNLGHP